MELDELVSSLEKTYKPLIGLPFRATFEERRNTTALATGGPRDILLVQDGSTIATLFDIIHEVNVLQRKYNRQEGTPEETERVWKGITSYNGIKLWVLPCDEEDGSEDGVEEEDRADDGSQFRVTNIEVLTGLHWVKEYIALVNIKVEKVKKEKVEESD